MTNELFQQVRLVDPVSGTDRVTDVLWVDGKIAAIAPEIPDVPVDTHIRDCRGLVLGPGLVDLYSYSGEPGFEERETLTSLQQAAAAGGFTRVTLLPDTHPAIDNPASVGWLRSHSQRPESNKHPAAAAVPTLDCWGALTQGVKGQQMTELAELATSGIVGFADGQPIPSLSMLRRLLEYLRPLKKPVAIWCFDRELAAGGVMREGAESLRFGLPGIPEMAETSAITSVLECVAAIGTPVHLMRVSTARSVELIQTAKARGLPVTASTTWMHLLLTSDAVASYDPSLHLKPPLGSQADRIALLQGIQAGVIDAIAIDHRPYTYEEKTLAFAEAPPGAIGLELALPLLWQNLVELGALSALELWQALSMRPAECLEQPPGQIVAGRSAELTLFNPRQVWTVENQTLKSRAINTPWFGKQLMGRVIQTWS
ncbi:MAG: dihydroorotase [Scytolyngbya sp. HA4215-MV1]|jgi:dihydroorotase|nr:dihydroorotase [Scytolyngbya sp. HA4215-MV1]